MRHKGFTWIELVIVLIIIGILAAILFPVFQRPHGDAKRSSCQSNLKQIGLGFMQYVQDYDEVFPRAAMNKVSTGKKNDGWVDNIQPYIKSFQLFQCPSEMNMNIPSDETQKNYTDYWMNSYLSGTKSKYLLHPATTLLSGDGNDGSDQSDARYSINTLPQNWIDDGNSPAYRHREMANYLFADGHVKSIKPDKIKTQRNSASDYHFAIK